MPNQARRAAAWVKRTLRPPSVASEEPNASGGVSRHAPHLLAFAGGMVAFGIQVLFVGPPPGSIEATLHDTFLVRAWAVALIVTGGGIIQAAFVRSRIIGLARERLWLIAASFAAVTYACAAYALSGPQATGAAITYVVFDAANVWRVWQVTREFRDLGDAARYIP